MSEPARKKEEKKVVWKDYSEEKKIHPRWPNVRIDIRKEFSQRVQVMKIGFVAC